MSSSTEPEAVVARLGRLSAALAAAAEARASLARRLEVALEVRREAVLQGAALDEMRRRLELRRRRAAAVAARGRRAAEGISCREPQLRAQVARLLPLSSALAAADQQVQEAKEVLSGERLQLGNLQRVLRMRQRYMMVQIAALYPVKVFNNNPRDATVSGENGAPVLDVVKSPQVRSLTFFGWQITKHKRKQKNYGDKELQRSAAVLGYAAHAVSLIASYLDVPLRYPVRFGGSRSYISDCLPSAEATSVSAAECPSINGNGFKLTEYPLFLECQEDDSTKASYAIYLLHKDTEQLLNYIGAEGSETRHVFGNLRELFSIIQSNEYVYR